MANNLLQLQGTLERSSGISFSRPTACEHQALPTEIQRNLATSYAQAINQNWFIPKSARHLSERERQFLKTHSVEAINASFKTDTGNPLLDFCIQAVKTTLSQACYLTLQNVFSAEDAQETNRGSRSLASEKKDSSTEESATRGKDPSMETMKKISAHVTGQRIRSTTIRLIRQEMDLVGRTVGEDRLIQALSEGAAIDQGFQITQEAMKSHEAFIRQAGITVGAAIKSGSFLSKVEEIGWHGATAETVKSTMIDIFSKQSAKIIGTLVECTNPVWCTGVISTIIAESLVPTETAPPEHDMRPPLPIPALSDVTQSRIDGIVSGLISPNTPMIQQRRN